MFLTRRSLRREFLCIRWGGGLFSPRFPKSCKLFCFSIVHSIMCVCAQRNQVPLTPCILRKFIGWPYVMYCCCVYVSAIPSILSASEFVPIQDSFSKSFPAGIFVIHKAHFPFHCVAQPPVHAPSGCICALRSCMGPMQERRASKAEGRCNLRTFARICGTIAVPAPLSYSVHISEGGWLIYRTGTETGSCTRFLHMAPPPENDGEEFTGLEHLTQH